MSPTLNFLNVAGAVHSSVAVVVGGLPPAHKADAFEAPKPPEAFLAVAKLATSVQLDPSLILYLQ